MYKYIFGPVPSRRLKISLGIDPIPKKVCSFNCVYCEVGKTTQSTTERKPYIKAEEIITELKDFLGKNPKMHIDYITFSGSGEPTLNSELGLMIDEIKKFSNIPVAVITNSSLLHLKEVRKELSNCDVVLPSLDAVSPDIFKKINHPAPNIDINQIIEGLIKFRQEFSGKMFLEVLIVKNVNDKEEEYRRLAEVIKKIDPDRIDINTVVRPPGYGRAMRVSNRELEKLQMILGKKAVIIPDFKASTKEGKLTLFDNLVNMLKIRPCTLDEIAKSLQVEKETVKMALNGIKIKGKLKESVFEGKTYYKIINN